MLRLCIVFKPLNPLNNLLWLGGINISLLLQVRGLRLQQWLGPWVQTVCSRAHDSLSSLLLLPQHTHHIFFYTSVHKEGNTSRGYEDSLVENSLSTAQSPSLECHSTHVLGMWGQAPVSWWRARGTLTPSRCWGRDARQGSTRHNYQSFLLRWNGTDMEFQETPCKVNEN